MEVIEHVADVQLFIARCAEMVKPGGFLVVATLNRTMKSFALAIVGAEAYVLGWLPRGDPSLGEIRHADELEIALELAGFGCGGNTGVIHNLLADRLADVIRRRRESAWRSRSGIGVTAGWLGGRLHDHRCCGAGPAQRDVALGSYRHTGHRRRPPICGFCSACRFRCCFQIGVMVVLGRDDVAQPRLGVLAWVGSKAPAAQFAATALMLAAMTERSFVVAIALYHDTEPIQVALFGFLLLGDDGRHGRWRSRS